MDWALILEAIIYLSHIGCQMDVCPGKKIQKKKVCWLQSWRGAWVVQQKRLKRRRRRRKKLLQRSYRLLLQRQRERKGRRGIRWLLMSICSGEPSLQVLNYLGGAGRFSLEDVSADRWLMSRIRSHSFLCLHVCMTLTSRLCRWTWHLLLYEGEVLDRETELIVLSICVKLFQVINFSLLFYKLHSGQAECAVHNVTRGA